MPGLSAVFHNLEWELAWNVAISRVLPTCINRKMRTREVVRLGCGDALFCHVENVVGAVPNPDLTSLGA